MTPHLLLFAFGQEDHNPPLPLAARPPHPLHQSDGGLGGIVANDEVHLTNVEAFKGKPIINRIFNSN